MKSILRMICLVTLLSWLSACGINNIPTYDEQVKAAWAQVENQYQRRADLIPNLVSTVKGYMEQEKEVLVAVTEARSRVGGMQAGEDLLSNPEKFQQFQQAQSQLGSALQRLMVVVERYPDLMSNQSFLALQSQLEGTENRIAVARRDFIQAVQLYNTELRTFPGRIWHSMLYAEMEIKPNFEASTDNAEQAPAVDFQ